MNKEYSEEKMKQKIQTNKTRRMSNLVATSRKMKGGKK